MFFLRSQRASWHLFWCPNVMLCWEPNGFPDICFWCPRLMCFFYSPDICFWCTKLLYRLFESPASFLTFVLAPKTHVFDHSEFPDICCWCPKLMFFWEPRRFPDICFGAQNWCIVSKSPAGFLTFVFWFQNSCFLRSRRVSWPLFLVPKTHVFWEPGRFPDICFGAQISCVVESPVCFLTLVFGAQDSCFFDSPDICFWCTKLLYRLFESPASFLTFVFGAQNTCVFLRCQRVSWHLLLVSKTHVFGEPRRFPDICFGAQNSCKESPAGFLIFVFWLKNSAFWEVPKTHVFWKLSEFAECPRYIILESPEGSLTFVLETQISCFFESPMGFLTFVFGAQDSCFFFWQPRHLLLVHKLLYRLFESPASFLTFVFGAQNTCFFFEIPASFLTFVVGVQNSCFWRAQKVSWHLFWCPKFMYCLKEPGEFTDLCFWCPKLMLFYSPEGFVTFVFGAQNSCFFESPVGFLTFVWCPRFMFLFWQPRHLLLVHKTLVQVVWEPGEFPDICFWRPKHMFFLRSQRASWHLLLVSKTHVFGEPRRFPDICFGTPNSCIFLKSPAGFLIFVFGSKTHAFWEVPKTHVFWKLSEFPECPRYIILESPEVFLTFVLEPQNSCFFESPMGFLTFVFGAQDSCFFLPAPTFPASFLTFVFGAQNTCFFLRSALCKHICSPRAPGGLERTKRVQNHSNCPLDGFPVGRVSQARIGFRKSGIGRGTVWNTKAQIEFRKRLKLWACSWGEGGSHACGELAGAPLSCLVQIPANHRQQIVHLLKPHTDTSKSNVKRSSSRGYDLLRALGSASCDTTHETGDTSCDITHEPRARFVAVLIVCWNTKKQHVCVTVSLPWGPSN